MLDLSSVEILAQCFSGAIVQNKQLQNEKVRITSILVFQCTHISMLAKELTEINKTL